MRKVHSACKFDIKSSGLGTGKLLGSTKRLKWLENSGLVTIQGNYTDIPRHY